jgi:hypothetical protein
MHLLKRAVMVAAVVSIPFIGAAPASAGAVDCTLGYPGTLLSNPNDPTWVEAYPQVHAHGPVDYSMWIVNGTIGYANCVL